MFMNWKFYNSELGTHSIFCNNITIDVNQSNCIGLYVMIYLHCYSHWMMLSYVCHLGLWQTFQPWWKFMWETKESQLFGETENRFRLSTIVRHTAGVGAVFSHWVCGLPSGIFFGASEGIMFSGSPFVRLSIRPFGRSCHHNHSIRTRDPCDETQGQVQRWVSLTSVSRSHMLIKGKGCYHDISTPSIRIDM